ncbi:MAG: hypothetical protein HY518_00680 [Candidatus Aenigmarchaeota archaeon]|nr:hypothetical protein [Candidatus Aenigmarchaeota archaeon]
MDWDKPREECGIIVGHSLHDAYYGAKVLQHRGQEAAGFSALNSHEIVAARYRNHVKEVPLEHLFRFGVDGTIVLGHVRYSTSGTKILKDAHPHVIGGEDSLFEIIEEDDEENPRIRRRRYGLLSDNKEGIEGMFREERGDLYVTRGAKFAAVHNGTIVNHHELTADTDDCDTKTLLRLYSEDGAEEVIRRIPAAYSAALMNAETGEVAIVRDRYGIRPLWIGEKNGKILAASEDIAIWEIGGEPLREVNPGEVIYIKRDGGFDSKQVVPPEQHFCFFEYNYLAHPNSVLGGRKVRNVRYRLGEELAREFRPDDVDMVTYVPKAPEPCALGYENATKIPFLPVFYKIDEDERSFMLGHSHERSASIERNLAVRPKIDLTGKAVLIIDDSIVRGNVSDDAVRKARAVGARKVYFASVTPPIGMSGGKHTGCLYGVDMPVTDNFAIRRHDGSVERLREAIGADALHYLSLDGMLRAIRYPRGSLCTYCITGDRPDRPMRASG